MLLIFDFLLIVKATFEKKSTVQTINNKNLIGESLYYQQKKFMLVDKWLIKLKILVVQPTEISITLGI